MSFNCDPSDPNWQKDARQILTALLQDYSAEVTSGDRKSIEAAVMMQPESEVFIASPPSDTSDRQVLAAAQLSRGGLTPVPHLVARNIRNLAELDAILGRLTNEAGVDRALILAGDRDTPVGELHSSLQIIESGMLGKHGIRRIAVSAYPEGHPRVSIEHLIAARAAKLKAAELADIEVTIVSQFCFDHLPIIALAEQLRAEGIKAPLRVGVAGPTSRTALLKYAMMCGIGSSIRALKERQAAAHNILTGETPEALLTEVARAQTAKPALGIQGVHFFTFASLTATAKWVQEQRRSGYGA